MTFLETRLDLGLDFGASYGPRFSTAIAVQSDGTEQRRAMWTQPLIVISLAGRKVNRAELDYLLAFHANVKGAAYGFRARDWSDYKSGLTAIGTGNGTLQSWQLVKRYTVGSNTVTRPITKPVANSLTLYLDGVATAANWSLDTTTGILYTELTGAIAVDFEFDVPVRFNEDRITFQFDSSDPFDCTRQLFTLQDVTLTEIRVEPAIYPPLDPPPSGSTLFNIGYDYRTQGGPEFDTGIQATASEFELRTPYRDNPIGSWNIGDRTLTRSELDYWLAFFRVHRGMAHTFSYYDWQTETTKTVRFAEDRIAVQFNAYRPHDEEVIFNLGGVAISETIPFATYNYTLNLRCKNNYNYTLNLRYKNNSSDPFTDLTLTFNAVAVNSILLGELNTGSGGIGATGFPAINWIQQTTGGETIYTKVEIVDENNNIRFLSNLDLIPPTYIEGGSNPIADWIACANFPGSPAGDLRLFEFVSLVQN